MLQLVGDLLPIAIGVSISPLPIIGLILILMSAHANSATPAFVVGWMAAISVALIVFTYLSAMGLGHQSGPHPIAGALKLLLGLTLLFLAYREWRQRPAPGETGHLPHWLSAVQNMGPLSAAGMGFAIYIANPKNLTLGIAAGVTFGAALLPPGARLIAGSIYVLLAASTVLLPAIAFFAAKKRVRPWLDEMREWLTQHNAALMAALLAVIGGSMVGKGLAAFG